MIRFPDSPPLQNPLENPGRFLCVVTFASVTDLMFCFPGSLRWLAFKQALKWSGRYAWQLCYAHNLPAFMDGFDDPRFLFSYLRNPPSPWVFFTPPIITHCWPQPHTFFVPRGRPSFFFPGDIGGSLSPSIHSYWALPELLTPFVTYEDGQTWVSAETLQVPAMPPLLKLRFLYIRSRILHPPELFCECGALKPLRASAALGLFETLQNCSSDLLSPIFPQF